MQKVTCEVALFQQEKMNPDGTLGAVPLCVSVGGSIIKTDLWWESLLLLLKHNPLLTFLLPFWWARGWNYLNEQIHHRVFVDVETLPYNFELLQFLKTEKHRGREITLIADVDQHLAHRIAHHLGIFDHVIIANGSKNSNENGKLTALLAQYGKGKFEYAGSKFSDLPIWANAHCAIVVSGSLGLVDAVGKVTNIQSMFSKPATSVQSMIRALRPHQWTKNLLVGVPLLTAHEFGDSTLVLQTIFAMVSFTLCASGVYLINDLLDLSTDRQHHQKKHRPLASGEISIASGLAMVPVLLIGSLGVSFLLPAEFGIDIALYGLGAIGYSLYCKLLLIGDVLVLAGLYTIRLISGAAAIEVTMSSWLLTFSLVFFTSMALVKRYTELNNFEANDRETLPDRRYRKANRKWIKRFGIVAGLLSVLILVFYVNSQEVTELYTHPERLWLICPIFFYWIGRVWYLASEKLLPEDPVVFAVKDKTTYVLGGIILLTMWVAWK